jgi:HAD superfamily hydrolase (TIGR01509 family)
MGIRAIIFDKDGVLINSEELKATAWQHTLAVYGVENGFSWYLSNLGPTSLSLAQSARNLFKIKESSDKISKSWHEKFAVLKNSVRPIESNIELLKTLSRKYLIGVASSMDRETIEAEMRKFGCRKFIKVCLSGEDVAYNKPAPDVYLKSASILQVQPSECIAIEDSPAGIHAAKTAGMFCIGFKNDLYDLDLSEADIVLKDLNFFDFETRCLG